MSDSEIDYGRILDAVKQITPGLVLEHGRHPDTAQIVDYVEQNHADLDIRDGDMDLLVDELKESAETYTPAAH